MEDGGRSRGMVGVATILHARSSIIVFFGGPRMTRAVQCLLPPAVLVALLVALGAPAAYAAVSVQKKPAVVERKTFDPNNKPAEMPPLNPGELAVTSSQFDCAAEVQIIPKRSKTRGGRHTLS